ncbi:hypothetical protein OGM63_27400 [Plectonema radiosum NIES-515]|uniref:Type II secretion system protein GspC N-terminal domain-containing protein n=1 Tax=Plectonema radiosum NIES-515 TaxID=2986073 RepID=A0ABT3B739_9CYAN|nr:hypothetical protein [Plectonema radiosum]MCV3217191.1 hypothetical protein [Plectonema radiosum NIES-515]
MSQQASTHLIIPEPSEELIGSEPWSIESYADGFMDELFADIDNVLHSNGMPSQTIHYGSRGSRSRIEDLQTALYPEYVIPTPRTAQIVLPETSQPIQTASHVVGATGATKSVRKKHHKARIALGKLLSFGATLGVAIAGMIFLLNSGLINRVNSKLIEQSIQQPKLQTQLAAKVEVEADLVQYMLGALATIDRQEARTSQKSTKSAIATAVIPTQTAFAYVTPTIKPSARGNLPPVLAANNTTPPAASRTTIVERIYIPVYQAPQPMRYAPPPIAGVRKILPAASSHASKPTPVKNALKSVPKPAKPVPVKMVTAAVRTEFKPVAVRTAPITLRQPSNPLPVLKVTAFQAAPPKLPVATAPEVPTPKEPKIEKQAYLSTVAAPTHTLEGLLELGDKSAALFKVDGVTRRIDVGESIGSSGWTLVEVSKGEAVVRRNGEVRSIYTGQNL